MLSRFCPSRPPAKGSGRGGHVAVVAFFRAFSRFSLLLTLAFASLGARAGESSEGLIYTNQRVAAGPWSIHVVRIPRHGGSFEFETAHANRAAIGMGALTSQIESLDSSLGIPVVAVNGDYYQRDKAYAGDPRGVQIAGGELLSAPSGGACFWIDSGGNPHAARVDSNLRVSLPMGPKINCGLNEDRAVREAEIYTPALGASTRTVGGREFVLERNGDGPWLPLRTWEAYQARIKSVSDSGNTPLTPQVMVFSVSAKLAQSLPELKPGDTLQVSTASTPSLKGARMAIGGGPLLAGRHKVFSIEAGSSDSYQSSSMFERHPRTAVGWNKDYYFLVVVDGRQPDLSVGMTLAELARRMVDLGCDEAMNLDGGGSSELWFDGKIRNSPCDGKERQIANSLIVVRRPAGEPQSFRKP